MARIINPRLFSKLKAISFILMVITSFEACKDYGDSSAGDNFNSERIEFKETSSFYMQGKKLFNEHCRSCHRNPDGSELHEIMFEGIFDRMPEPADDYFVRYVSDSKGLEKAGDQYALNLKKEYGGIGKHDFKDRFSRDDFKALILYIRISLDVRKRRYTKELH